jgi:hypothetical protein
MLNVYKNQQNRQTGSRNLTGPKTLPTIWYTYMMLVTKYQISAITYFLFADLVGFYTHLTYICICTFFVAFFSATIDDRNLIFGHKHHKDQMYIVDLFLNKILFLNKMNCELMLTYDTPALWQTGGRNLTGQKTLPTIWGTYMHFSSHFSQQLLMTGI